jgi:hypothetical protein
MSASLQDSTNSSRVRKIGRGFSRGMSFSTRSLSVGWNIYNAGTASFVYGSNIYNINLENAIVSGVRNRNGGAIKDYQMRGADLARACLISNKVAGDPFLPLTDYKGNLIPASLLDSTKLKHTWFAEILYIAHVPQVFGTPQEYAVGYGVLGLTTSWGATSLQVRSSVSSPVPLMTLGGGKVSIAPTTSWLQNFQNVDSGGYVIAKVSLCDPFYADYQSVILGSATISQTNENDTSVLKDGNVKLVGEIPSQNIDLFYNTLPGAPFPQKYDQGRILNLRNSIVQGSNLNVDFYPSGMSNSVFTGFRYPPLRLNATLFDFWAEDLYSEFNSYNCSHLGYNTTPPSGYIIPEIASMTKTSGQIYFGQSFSVAGYRNYPFCGGFPT